MGRIKKAAGPKHEATLSPALAEFVTTATSLPISHLPTHLSSFPRRWPFPRGDLYHWIPLLGHFDTILEQFNSEYGLHLGPQTQPFTRLLLEKGIVDDAKATTPLGTSQGDLDALGFGPEGDRELVETILAFSRVLVENCGNRSLYSSSDRLGAILNTTSLSLLSKALRLAVRLAQRYYVSRQRGSNPSQSLNNALLASHYNIDLEKVQKIAAPFAKSCPPASATSTPTASTTPSSKDKAKVGLDNIGRRKSPTSIQASDLYAMAKEETSTNGSLSKAGKGKDEDSSGWEDWGEVSMNYYQTSVQSTGGEYSTQDTSSSSLPSAPIAPPFSRRASGLSRPSRLSRSEEQSSPSAPTTSAKPDEPSGGLKVIEIPQSTISSVAPDEVLRDTLPKIPKDSHYELLSRVRAAHALSHSLITRRQILEIRILAVTNLAYVYSEPTFQQKVLQQDSDEPRRLQLVYQLANLVHPPDNGSAGLPLELKSIAVGALEALTKHKTRAAEVNTALSINVNHGVLLYILRKVVADMTLEDSDNEGTEGDEWREALFSLLEALPTSAPRTADSLVAAGLIDLLIETLTLRTNKAERSHPKVLMFLNTIIYTVRDAFQTLANARGLDVISDLTAWEVETSLQRANQGSGIPDKFRNHVIDYRIPYFQQQTLRWLFKFVNHMMQHGNANFDRLLRNLIDSPQLLSGLRTVIANGKVFGSNVWSGAVNILSSFIHNEPTSYAVIAEAGLSKVLLEAITLKDMTTFPTPGTDTESHGVESQEHRSQNDATIIPPAEGDGTLRPRRIIQAFVWPEAKLLAQGILPATDAIVTIPQAFGAICLNNAGLELFSSSGALDSFFEIFESPDHVKSMNLETDLPRVLGNSFDELVRHHPRLRAAVMKSVILMTARVGLLCRIRAWEKGVGAKLWAPEETAQMQVSGGKRSLLGEIDLYRSVVTVRDGEDVIMSETSGMRNKTHTFKIEESIDKDDETEEPTVSTFINVAVKFLAGFFENHSLCANFIERGGAELVLDFATLPSLPHDFNNHIASQEIARAVHMLAEQKPHLVLPSLIRRTQKAVDALDELTNHTGGSAFFSDFTVLSPQDSTNGIATSGSSIDGTSLVKALVSVHTLSNVLSESFSPLIFNARPSHTLFSQVNLADMYVTLTGSLGRLHRACVWEEILLQKSIPDSWKEATRIKGYGMGSKEADEVFGFISRNDVTLEQNSAPTTGPNSFINNLADFVAGSASGAGSDQDKKGDETSPSKDEKGAQFRNVKSLRYLLSQIPSAITPFFQNLGKNLITKRRLDSYARQNAYLVADALAKATLEQLEFEVPQKSKSVRDRYAYWIVILTSTSKLMVEGSPPHSQCLTLVLQAFKTHGGLDTTRRLLETFFAEVEQFSSSAENPDGATDGAARMASAYGGIRIIFDFYSQIVRSKVIVEASQAMAIASSERDKEQPHYFSPPQFLVELRMAVLPEVERIWDSDFVDKASSSILKCLIDILRVILDSDHEQGAMRRSDRVPTRGKAQSKVFEIPRDKVTYLKSKGFTQSLVHEALYRCMKDQNAAEEYCKAHTQPVQREFPPLPPRAPIPLYDLEKERTPTPARTPTPSITSQGQDSEATVPDVEITIQPEEPPAGPAVTTDSQSVTLADPLVEIEEADGDVPNSESVNLPPPAPGVPPGIDGDDGDGMAMSIDNLLNITEMLTGETTPAPEPSVSNDVLDSASHTNGAEVGQKGDVVTIDDLNDARATVRKNLIDRALDVLNVHGDVTFELSDLIVTAAMGAADVTTMRREIGETLVQSLISFQMDEDFRPSGQKVAAYANLLALVLQQGEFYEATLDELKAQFSSLLGFIKIFPDQTSEEPSPWIGQILLVVEKLLAEDTQPEQIQWMPPSQDDTSSEDSMVELVKPLIPVSEKGQLFDSILEILPRIGKDEGLALSVTRILVILTRDRDLAIRLGEKRNLQRLFVMVKQMAGLKHERLQSSFMLVLRHIIEDDDIVRQIFRSEIISEFEKSRAPTDISGYVTTTKNLVLRSPRLFVETTNELLKIERYDPNQRLQILSRKYPTNEITPSTTIQASAASDATKELVTEHSEAKSAKPSTEDSSLPTADKLKSVETKVPVVENPDGVIHYLLYELLSYKDVEDKESTPSLSIKDGPKEGDTSSTDVEMTNGVVASSPASDPALQSTEPKKAEKTEFKADQHPIFVYRCFLLQCLTELLASYNRAKIEFVSFSRKADPKAPTSSKPRSGVLNYFLNALIPTSTLNREESLTYQKKATTSNWAMSTVVALCLHTENGDFKSFNSYEEKQEPELLFVRKFVLEHALKSFKDANASNEPLDSKYAHMLGLVDLFSRMLSVQKSQNLNQPGEEMTKVTQKALAKIMFEKNFISVLTASIADIDLNFPGSKRAVKYILRPLKHLTSTALDLSETSSNPTTLGHTDDEEISTASSVSEIDDEREETPDLFRNSTLGMFEPGREQASSSGDSDDDDEDMYDDEYDDGMDFEEEMDRDGDEVISDEDEEIEGAGHMEGLPGDVGMDVEVVIDGEEEEPSDDDDPDDSEDIDDEDDEVEVIDEINGDNENDSLGDGDDEEEWQDEDDGEGYNVEDDIDRDISEHRDPMSAVRDVVEQFNNASGALQQIDSNDLIMDIDNGTYMDDVVRDNDEDEEDEDDEAEDEDVIYEPEYEDDEPEMPDAPWNWDAEDEQILPMTRGHHHHHHHSRRGISPWTIFTGHPADRGPDYRSHRRNAPESDQGTNPLLQRPDRLNNPTGTRRASRPHAGDPIAGFGEWIHGLDIRNHANGPVSVLNEILNNIGSGGPSHGTIGGPFGALHFHVAGGRDAHAREFRDILNLRQQPQEIPRPGRGDPDQAVAFSPSSTTRRWHEEARMLFNVTCNEKTQRVINSLLKVLVPPAIQEEKKRKEFEAEQLRIAKAEGERVAEEQRVAKEKAEQEARDKREREEREAAERTAQEAQMASSGQEEDRQGESREEAAQETMEGLESSSTQVSSTNDTATLEGVSMSAEDPTSGPSETAERVRITIRGRDLDITGMGIDLEYLEALPEELREEVLMHQLAEQRSQAAAAGEEPTDISREFLEALPPEIREELLQNEAQDRRRREREEMRRGNAANGGPPVPRAEDMDPASFLASLDPTLRQAVLMEQDEEVLAHLPSAIAAEARALGGDRLRHYGEGPARIIRTGGFGREPRGMPDQAAKRPQRRQIIQMLDKAGVATLLRLMFIPQQGSSKHTLNDILQNVSQNRQNRAEVISLLLTILQDGSADVNAIERSFAHLSLRAKLPSSQKTPQPLKRTLSSQASSPTNAEMTPLMVVQQCLSALVHLTVTNPHIPSFFLTEHETSSGLKSKSGRKGKAKENRATKFALNALLSLLDRKLIMDTSGCMEQLSTLLQNITHPLTMLLRKDKDKTEESMEGTGPNSSTAQEVPMSEELQPTEATAPDDTTMGETSPSIPSVADEVVTPGTTNDPAPRSQEPNLTEVKGDEGSKSEGESKPRKQRNLTPPVVPEENLRLVVNILAARECSAKTFRDTLSTINNLSAIPGAKEVFGKELIKQAQDLGESILHDLDDLVPQIQRAGSGTDIQGVALIKFSPASSDQAKLLRVLTALDYLFDPKRNGGKTKPLTENHSEADAAGSKDDLLTTLYENSTFGPLWSKLSECLSTIRQRENMLNVATILLPLIEALMVVCKNTTLKDAPLVKAAKEFAVSSPPPESRMENLFFRFTEDHRKILNDLVRHNPRLMSGTFSLLVKNPKVLEFDNKRNYFTRRLHSRGTETTRHSQPPLQLAVRRDQVFLDSFKSLYFKSGDEMKYGKLSIRFHGEEGVDAGGVTREWFQVLSRQMFNPDYALFIPVASDRTTFHPNKLSTVNPEHLMFFKFIGRIIGKALYEGRALDCHFSRAVYKRILGRPVSIKDMETLDLDYYKSLLWMLENDITDIITETFSIENEAFGVTQIVDLIDNGHNIPVTDENKQEYVQLVIEYRLTGSVQTQLEEFLKGFHDVVPPELISIFNEQELELLISGLPDIDVDDWKNNTEYHNYSASSSQIQWFWRAVRSFDKEERAKLLQFVTGTSKVPLNGFKELEGMNGFSRFNIHRDYGNKDRLPSSHTCFNQLDLPEYESYEALRHQVYTAMTAGSEYFGFA